LKSNKSYVYASFSADLHSDSFVHNPGHCPGTPVSKRPIEYGLFIAKRWYTNISTFLQKKTGNQAKRPGYGIEKRPKIIAE
jgi:hypothetical protein